MRKFLSGFLGFMLVVAPAVMAQQRNTNLKRDDLPITREFTGSVQLTMRFPENQVVELTEWQVSLATPAANTVTVTVARGTVTNQFQDVVIVAGGDTFTTAFWTDSIGISLRTGDTITWTNSAGAANAQLTYKFRHPGD